MNDMQSTLVTGSVDAVAFAVVAIVVAFFAYRYFSSTATLRFQARESEAARKQAAEAIRREDRLKSEERSAERQLANQAQARLDKAAEDENDRIRLQALKAEVVADVAGNLAAADRYKAILAEADVLLVQICRYYTERAEAVDPDDDDQEDPLINLGNQKKVLDDVYTEALNSFDEAQEMVVEGLYLAAVRHAESCLIDAKFVSDRIINLDTSTWNQAQSAKR